MSDVANRLVSQPQRSRHASSRRVLSERGRFTFGCTNDWAFRIKVPGWTPTQLASLLRAEFRSSDVRHLRPAG